MAEKPKQGNGKAAGDITWTPPSWLVWGVAWIALLVAPQSSDIFQFIASAQSAYGELRFATGNELVVVAKNSGSGALRFSAGSIDKHFCLSIADDQAFIPKTTGLIPPATYSVAILPYDGRTSPRMIYADGEAEVRAGRLRVMTPVEDMQYGFGAIIVVAMLVAVLLELHEWHLLGDFSMTGRRSEDP